MLMAAPKRQKVRPETVQVSCRLC